MTAPTMEGQQHPRLLMAQRGIPWNAKASPPVEAPAHRRLRQRLRHNRAQVTRTHCFGAAVEGIVPQCCNCASGHHAALGARGKWSATNCTTGTTPNQTLQSWKPLSASSSAQRTNRMRSNRSSSRSRGSLGSSAFGSVAPGLWIFATSRFVFASEYCNLSPLRSAAAATPTGRSTCGPRYQHRRRSDRRPHHTGTDRQT
jgi:hypothetical protein